MHNLYSDDVYSENSGQTELEEVLSQLNKFEKELRKVKKKRKGCKKDKKRKLNKKIRRLESKMDKLEKHIFYLRNQQPLSQSWWGQLIEHCGPMLLEALINRKQKSTAIPADYSQYCLPDNSNKK